MGLQGKFICILMIMVLVFGNFYTDVRIHAEPIEGSLQQYVEDMQPGNNLGNTFDTAGEETSWGNPVVTVQAIRDQGYRIATRWQRWRPSTREGALPVPSSWTSFKHSFSPITN